MRNASLLPAFALFFCAYGQVPFQQRVDHAITVRLDDQEHVLHGLARFAYHNNSPVALDTLWVHLWPNAYADRHTALCQQLDAAGELDLHFARAEDRGGIDSLDFRSEGRALAWGHHPQHADIGWIKLPTPLAGGRSITVDTPFRVKVPDGRFSRLGHTGQAYHITQWYPKPAVFDQEGWHAMPYLTQGEFFADFGRYEVSITLPSNYIVGATGLLQDADENRWLDSLAARPAPERRSPKGAVPFPPSAHTWKTLRFVQDSVHDFAWFADKRFVVRKGEVLLPTSGRTVTTWALSTPRNAALWENAVTDIQEALLHYSRAVGDYPYAACTAVDGTISAGGGMEYPMITIINDSSDPFELDVVIAHEVGHNWFYGILGSNERDHPWMDEGINSYYEQRYVEARYPGLRIKNVQGLPIGSLSMGQGITYREQNELMYRFNARRNQDSPPDTPSDEFSELDYGTTVYAKSAVAFDNLRGLLGEARYDSCMQAYFGSWRFKHPRPIDLERSFGMDKDPALASTFRDAIMTARKADRRPRHPMRSMVPEIDPRNDSVGFRFPEFKFLAGLERKDRSSIYWTPAIGYNTHDGWMPGITLRNTTVPDQRIEWVLAPLYGTQSHRLAGGGRIAWSHDRLNSRWLRNIHVGLSGFAASQGADATWDHSYQRLVPSLALDLRSRPNAVQHNIKYRSILMWNSAKRTDETDLIQSSGLAVTLNPFHELSFTSEQTKGIFPFSIQVTSLSHLRYFSRLSVDARWSAIYDKRKHRVTLRGFAGMFLNKAQYMPSAMGWRMYWGSSDLLHDNLFIDRQAPGRNTAQQMAKVQGGFKTPTSYGTSDSWIAALNLEADLPFRIPLSVFASYGAAPYTIVAQQGQRTDWKGYWEAGFGVRLVRDVVEMWIPLVYSKEIRDEVEGFRGFDFGERIRFVLALEKMDPTQLLRKAPH